MKRTLLLILLFFSSLSLFSQGNVEGGFYAGYFQLESRGFSQFGGILHIPVGEKFTLNYSLLLGRSNSGGLYVHTTAGLVAGLWMRNLTGGQGPGYLAFLLACVPEGMGMYLPAKGKITPHLSINPLSVEYFYRQRTSEEWGKLGCDVVMRLKMHPKPDWPLYVAPQLAATIIYTPGQMASRYGVKGGVTIGFEAD